MTYDVFGLGNALMDIQVFVPDELIKEAGLTKGIMHLVDEIDSRKILEAIKEYKPVSIPGGSCANTISALALLGGNVVYTGIVVDDDYGKEYNQKLISRGVTSKIKFNNSGLTGTSIILTTNDAERTMATHLGACRLYTIDDIDMNLLKNSKVFHCTGYQWDTETQKETVLEAMKAAKKNGLKVCFDIADPFCIERNVNDFKDIISQYVDILLGNKEEAKILTGLDDPVEAGKEIVKMGANAALVKVGSEGSYLFEGNNIEKINVYKADKVLDSTGCGDTYGAGFLYGFTQGYPLKKCAEIASFLAAQIISVPGVMFEELDFSALKKMADNL